MKSRAAGAINRWGGISFVSGVILAGSLIFLLPLPDLRGPQVTIYLAVYLVAAASYVVAVIRLG
ncbi:MAG: hypothetical protein JJE12_15460, partial [Anaerolineales bacterium]|nr:hypothetical protein [Anaerolineales bacterium]